MRFSVSGSSSHLGRLIRSTHFVLLFLLVTSCGLNVLLARRVRQLGTAIGVQSHQAQLEVGTLVSPIVAKELDGRSATVAYTGSNRLTILYIFTPQCGWCTKNSDNFSTLVKAKAKEHRFIGLSLSQVGLAEYVRTNKLTIPVLTGLSSETMNTYKLGGTPQMLVISPEGRVVKNWRGAWINKEKSDIEAFFQVNLPGIQLPSVH